MHRSGSSALTWALSRMGAGLPKHILGANSTNQYGHWEPELLLRQHDILLKGQGSSWDDWRPFKINKYSDDALVKQSKAIWDLIDSEYDISAPFVLKDPRVCRFAPFYLDLLKSKNVVPKVVIGVRNPLEVMASLKSRNGMGEGTGALLWLRHMLEAESASRDIDRVIIDYNQYLDSPEQAIQLIASELDVFEEASVASAIKASAEFVHPNQRHHNNKFDELDVHPLTASWVKGTYQALMTLRTSPSSKKARSKLDKIREALDEATPIIDRIHRDFQKESATELAEAKKKLQKEIEQDFEKSGGGKRVLELEEKLALLSRKFDLEKGLYEEYQSRQIDTVSALQLKTSSLELRNEELKSALEKEKSNKFEDLTSLIERSEKQKSKILELYKKLDAEDFLFQDALEKVVKSKKEIEKELRCRLEEKTQENEKLRVAVQSQTGTEEAAQLRKSLNQSERKFLESQQQIQQIRKQYRASERRSQAYYNSFSWKVTRPMRGVKRALTEKGFIAEAWAHMFPRLTLRPKPSPTQIPVPELKKKSANKTKETRSIKPIRPIDTEKSKLANDPYNRSTYNAGRPYPFPDSGKLDAIGKSYLEARAQRKSPAKVAVFMAITGGYDGLKYHEHLLPGADYFLFGENEFEAPYVYEYRKIEHFDEDPTRIARYVKTHAHTLLGDYEVAIWVDGNIIIREDISSIIEAFQKSSNILAAIPHPIRSDVYAEASECIARGKDENNIIEQQMLRYKDEGFKTEALIESNFIMFKPQDERSKAFLDKWWSEIETNSKRDQLSLNYALSQFELDYDKIVERPNSIRNHPKFALLQHGAEASDLPSVKSADEDERKELAYSDVRNDRIALQSRRKIDIIVCVHNALEVVQPCLESVQETRNLDNHQIIIVDDGSGEETQNFLEGFSKANQNVKLIRNEKAGGYTRAANKGLKASTGEFMVLLNSDTVVAPNWLEKMADAVFSRPGCGIVGPMSNAASSQSVPEHRSSKTQTVINTLPEGLTVAQMDQWCEENTDVNFLPRTSLVHGFCFGITRETIDKIGYFDEDNFPSGYGEENDYCLRAVSKGISLVIASHTYVFHVKSSSYTPEARIPLMKAGNTKLRDIHGYTRVARAIRSLQNNPYLGRMRSLAANFYSSNGYKH